MLNAYPEEISRLIRDGKLNARKENGKWLISESDLEAFAESHLRYKGYYSIHKKRVELADLRENNPKEYYEYKIKQALEGIRSMQVTLDRHYKKLESLLNEEA
jgi:hypothetical protein